MISDFDTIPELSATFGPAKQIAYIVRDIDAAMQHWHDDYGVGPFLVTRNAAPLNNAYYRGKKAVEVRVNIAFSYVGDVQLELIEWNAVTRPYFDGLEKLVKSADAQQLMHEFELARITPKAAVLAALARFMVKKLFGRVRQTRRPVADSGAAGRGSPANARAAR